MGEVPMRNYTMIWKLSLRFQSVPSLYKLFLKIHFWASSGSSSWKQHPSENMQWHPLMIRVLYWTDGIIIWCSKSKFHNFNHGAKSCQLKHLCQDPWNVSLGYRGSMRLYRESKFTNKYWSSASDKLIMHLELIQRQLSPWTWKSWWTTSDQDKCESLPKQRHTLSGQNMYNRSSVLSSMHTPKPTIALCDFRFCNFYFENMYCTSNRCVCFCIIIYELGSLQWKET